jgi:transcriptional regulator with XRE-family HTH domain
VSPEEIKQLRKELKLSARQLATALKTEAEDVWAWESGEQFPTKRFVTRMQAMLKKGAPKANAVQAPSTNSPSSKSPAGMAKLADPQLWQVIRKLVAHPELFTSVVKLAEQYDDPNVSQQSDG